MTPFRLILDSLRFYWRTHLAVLLGVVAGTAVIGGALIVGDSVRESLKQISLKRLGGVDLSLNGQRFFPQSLTEDLADDSDFSASFDSIAPALAMKAGLQRTQGDVVHRANQVGFWGIDDRLWKLIAPANGPPPAPADRDIILSSLTAEALGAKEGDEISVWVELPSSIPRDSLLGDRDQTSREFVFTVSVILDGSSTADRFQLTPTQQLTRNAYVSLDTLQDILDLAAVRARRDTPAKPARINAAFVASKTSQETDAALTDAQKLNDLLSKHVDLSDLGLRLRTVEDGGYLALESEQMILDRTSATAGREAGDKLGVATSPVLVYLANEIANADDLDKFSMYSVLAGVDRSTLEAPPFGPMTMSAGDWPPDLPSDEIVLNDWIAKDLGVQPGGGVRIKWHVVGSHGELPEEEHFFKVSGIVKLDGTPADDRGFTPELPGITDVNSLDEWDQPFPMDLDRTTDRDELYWSGDASLTPPVKSHRATPKGFIALRTAQTLWSSRYGNLTSIRYAPPEDRTLDDFRQDLNAAIRTALDPQQAGLAFQPTKFQGLQAAQGTTDFSGLFIAFSFFLILSAAILIGLLFRLGVERRVASIGLLNAVGMHENRVRRVIFGEALIVLFLGSIVGALAAVAYAKVMVYGLNHWWVGAVGTNELVVAIKPLSVVLGSLIGVIVAVIALWWSLRQLKHRSYRSLLAGNLEDENLLPAKTSRRSRIWALSSGGVGLVLLLGALTGLIPETEAFGGFSWKIVLFFIVGVLCLTAALTGFSAWIARDSSSAVSGTGAAALSHLAVRNAARNRTRSVFTAGLISSATFVIVAVAAGHRNPAAEHPDYASGNGGFNLVAQSSQPVLFDLNTADGRRQLDLLPDPGSPAAAVLDKIQVVPFRINPGQEASCLNLYTTQLPTILGATPAMIERGGFKFSGASVENPWTLLEEKLPDQDGLPVYPVLGDMNTLQYSLHKGVGQRVPVPNEREPVAWLEIVGMYDGSIFQGVLVASEANFLKLFPERQGYGWFLIGSQNPQKDVLTRDEANTLSEFLESRLSPFGFDTDRVSERLDAFLQVQNTYLTTFQTLGGLGLLLGTIGLGTVMLRNVVERRSELALMRAVGFRNRSVGGLVLYENAFLLAWGLFAGAASALLAMAPHLLSIGADVPWSGTIQLLVGVFIAGMLSALAALAQAVRTPVLSTLRGE